jgi:hypothetical protein
LSIITFIKQRGYKLGLLENKYCEFIEFESLNNLVNLDIHGVYAWRIVRYDIFNEFINKSTPISQPFHSLIISIIGKIQLYFKIKKAKHSKTELLFLSSAIYSENNSLKDQYLDFLISNSKSRYLRLTNIPDSFSGHDEVRVYENIFFFLGLLITFFCSYFLYPFDFKVRSFVGTIRKDLSVDYSGLRLKRIIMMHKYYKRFHIYKLKELGVKEVYFTCSYCKFNLALIDACELLGIKSIEIQHGVINKYNLAYYFNTVKFHIPYYPSKLIFFGNYWKNIIVYPNHSELSISSNHYSLIHRDISKVDIDILFVSSNSFSNDEFFYFANKFANHNSDYCTVFKLHPSEVSIKTSRLKIANNYLTISGNETNIYDLINRSEIIVVLDSTVAYESVRIMKRVFIANLYGSEALYDLISDRRAFLIEENSNFQDLLEIDFDHTNLNEYFEEN